LGVVIRVRPAPRQIAKVAAAARASDEVVVCERVTGDDCFVLRANVRDVEHLEELIDRFTPFGQTTTSLVQSAPVPSRGPRVAS
jgi:Lrp/AsnC family leucine-responsive transcriptional regulator